LKEAITGPQKRQLLLLEYDQLTKKPLQTMQALYNFIDEPYYQHDFDNVEATYDEYDLDAGIHGLHTIRKKVEFIQREPILPPDAWQEFANLEVWR
jgi:sulfotransferase